MRKVQLESLSVGRCFTMPVEPGPPEDGPADGIRKAVPVVDPADAWRVTDDAEAGFAAVSATGEEKTFAVDTEVVEIPRQGYDKLASR